GQHQPKRNRNHGGGNGGGGHRHEGDPARAAGDKPAFKGPSRGGNRGRSGSGASAPRPTGVWSNR
ncbi:MAG TPA: RNA helicase, partial [Phenylobacterium sp.]|nr:RNA helicase [Phenylobacterium sp.]